MERRNFLKGALALFGAAAVGATLTPNEAAAATPAPRLTPETPEVKPEPATDGDSKEMDADGQYYRRRVYYRRPRRIYYRRPRRVYYRRPRRIYYRRPRRVYYRPRRVYYRRGYFW